MTHERAGLEPTGHEVLPLGDRHGEHRRLLDLGASKLAVGPFGHQPNEWMTKHVLCFMEHSRAAAAARGEVDSHARALAALARE